MVDLYGEHKKHRAKKLRAKIIPMLLGVVLFCLLLKYSEFSLQELYRSWIGIKWSSVGAILLCTWGWLLAVSLRWAILVRYFTSFRQYVFGFFFYYTCLSVMAVYFLSQAVGNIGVKTFALQQAKGIRVAEGSFVVVLEHMLNLIIVLLLAIPSFFFLAKILSAGFSMFFMVFLLLLLLLFMFYYFPLFTEGGQFLWDLIKKVMIWLPFFKNKAIPEGREIFSRVKGDRVFISKLMGYSCAVYFFCLYRNYIYAQALGIDIPLVPLILAFPFVYVISLVGVTPGSIGVAELGWVGVLMLIGVDKEQATIFAVSIRLLNMMSILIVFTGSFLQYSLSELLHKKAIRPDKVYDD